MKKLLLFTAAMLLPIALPAAVTCGSIVTGFVQLTSDLICNSQSGLIVGADNTTIDLNGHTISCAGQGIAGTCQRMLDPANPSATLPPVGVTFMGIGSSGKTGVVVKGPGTIHGFNIGVNLSNGIDLHVSNVTVTGPAQPSATANQRLITTGVLMANMTCSGTSTIGTIEGNDISNQSIGIFLQNAECVRVAGNAIYDNNSRLGDAHGINLLNSRSNLIQQNKLARNGANRLGSVSDSGIQLLNGVNGKTAGNIVTGNRVSDNCGDGIAAVNGAGDNTIAQNEARFNGLSTFGGRCLAAPAGTFFDLAERNAGPQNVWNPNNLCRTNTATIPAGVCGPAE